LKSDVAELKTNAGEMKVYISQIFTMLNDIKAQLDASRQKSDNQWMDFFSRLVYIVLGGLVAYLFAKTK
jgi:hypothetical protein